jgi:hypothetical protein
LEAIEEDCSNENVDTKNNKRRWKQKKKVDVAKQLKKINIKKMKG